jgi:hypothetical protein
MNFKILITQTCGEHQFAHYTFRRTFKKVVEFAQKTIQ